VGTANAIDRQCVLCISEVFISLDIDGKILLT